jgi:hypothetical protein
MTASGFSGAGCIEPASRSERRTRQCLNGLTLSGLSEDGSRMVMRNEYFRSDEPAARVTSLAGWLDLERRRLTTPSPALLAALDNLPKGPQFARLPSAVAGK